MIRTYQKLILREKKLNLRSIEKFEQVLKNLEKS